MTTKRIMVLVMALAVVAVIASCGGGGGDSVLLSNNADLSSLTVSAGVLNPAYSSAQTEYSAMFLGQSTIRVTPTTSAAGATVTVNGTPVASGQASGAITLSSGANTINVLVTAQDGVTQKTYAISAHYLTQQAYIKSSNTGTSDGFGYSVALSGDTLAVGAIGEASNATGISNDQTDDSAPASGAVYVFTRTGATWTQQAYIKSSNTGTNDYFGYSVALSGDTLAVGAFGEASNATGIGNDQVDNSAPESGAVYVFTRTTGTTWTQQAYIKASNTEAGDNFGYSVALSGDTLAVGATGEASKAMGIGGNQADNSIFGSGAVYVFTRTTGTTWTQQAYIKSSNTDTIDGFGNRVALSGDTLAVGAFGEDSSATGIGGDQADNSALGSGAVYVFTRTDATWTQQAYIKASNTEADDYFGTSVALSGDTLAVGATGEASNATGINGDQTDNSAFFSGAVYVFTRTDATWSQQAYIKSSNTGTSDSFGTSVALSGDTLAVGTFGEASNATGINNDQTDNSLSFSGAVYVFTRTGATWTQQAYIKASNTEANDSFGRNVALSGDTLAVGAFGEDSNATGIGNDQADNSALNSGAVYVVQ